LADNDTDQFSAATEKALPKTQTAKLAILQHEAGVEAAQDQEIMRDQLSLGKRL